MLAPSAMGIYLPGAAGRWCCGCGARPQAPPMRGGSTPSWRSGRSCRRTVARLGIDRAVASGRGVLLKGATSAPGEAFLRSKQGRPATLCRHGVYYARGKACLAPTRHLLRGATSAPGEAFLRSEQGRSATLCRHGVYFGRGKACLSPARHRGWQRVADRQRRSQRRRVRPVGQRREQQFNVVVVWFARLTVTKEYRPIFL